MVKVERRPVYLLFFAFCIFLCGTDGGIAHSADVVLSWNANREPDLLGYKLYYGMSSREYSSILDIGNHTSAALSGLEKGRLYYFAATAYDKKGLESAFSEEITYVLPQKWVTLKASNGQYVCAEGGGGGLLTANRNAPGAWEIFGFIDLGYNRVAFQTHGVQYVCAEGGGGQLIYANRRGIGAWETFEIVYLGNQMVALSACNGQYVSAEGGGGGLVAADRSMLGPWEIFEMNEILK